MLLEDYATLIPNRVSPTHSLTHQHVHGVHTECTAAQWSVYRHETVWRVAEQTNLKLEQHYETTLCNNTMKQHYETTLSTTLCNNTIKQH
jgi:hypothetical protein